MSLACAAAATQLLAGDAISTEDADFFERRIRPLLIRACGDCHGDLEEPQGGLKLLSRESLLKGGESGPAIVPGDAENSLLISAIRYEGPEMPPDGKRLSQTEIANLTKWIERGAPWPQATAEALASAKTVAEEERIAAARKSHWSLQPVVDPPRPDISDPAWPQSGVDWYILAELDKHQLAPSPSADRRTLLRRLSFDFTGLPPTPAEVDAFLADPAPDAVSRVVDRLLASPHYGERWARHWLDVARYADTKGYVLFQDANFPWAYTYRDYVIRAFNDDLPYDRFIVEQLAADLLPLGNDRRPLTAMGFLTVGSGFMNNQHDVVDDRIDVITRGLLGLTVTCARCHDHKFDPIPTRDYYSLYGVLASSAEPTVPPLFEAPPRTDEYAAFAKELAEREKKLDDYLAQKHAALVSGARSRVAEYLLAGHAQRGKPPTQDFMLLADPDDLNPTMIIRYQVYLERSAQQHDPVWALWHALTVLPEADFAARAPAVIEQLISDSTGSQPLNQLVAGAFLSKQPGSLQDVARTYAELLLAASKLSPAPTGTDLAALQAVFTHHEAPAALTREQIGVLELLPDRKSQGERNELLTAVEKWRAEGTAAPPRAMVLEDLPQPVEARVFVRGNPTNLGEQVPRRFLRVLSEENDGAFSKGSGRLELAQRIADKSNPLTARVLVNRIWLAHFGTPLVSTPSDFGSRSERPSHPQLLDHLAAGFMRNGWSLKWLHREIVLSATYRQSSNDRADARRTDPENRLYWRMNRRRHDFETMRDSMLAVSGRLDQQIGGLPMPDVAATNSMRRTIYGKIDRLNLPGLYRTFDFPHPDATSPERSQTTVPQQALFFMNHPLVRVAADSFWKRPDVVALGDERQKIAMLFEAALGRSPAEDETAWALEFVHVSGETAWQQLAQAIFTANEFLFID
jgi:mono/diheme cytochrome c family protein